MTKTEYLQQLKKYLKRLPKEDYENAMEHFTEYFEDIGKEREQEAMEELGTPKEAAAELLKNLLRKDLEITEDIEEKKNLKNKKRVSAKRNIWISCLAIMAAPIALPVAFTIVACFFTLFLCLGCVLLMLGCLSLAAILVGIKLLLRGLVAIPYSLSGAGMIMGMGFFGIGFSILFWILVIYFYQWMKKLYLYFMKKIAERKEKKDE